MRIRPLAIILISMLSFSCDEDPTITETGYIKSKINGVETIYASRVDNNSIHFLGSNELHISFHKSDNKYLTWTIDIIGVDFQDMKLPFVINGPHESNLNEPTFWCNIVDSDPKNSNYGKNLAGTASFYWNATLTITSIEGKIVKGTFEGDGLAGESPAVFTDGEFVVDFN